MKFKIDYKNLQSRRRKKRREYIIKYYIKPNHVASLYYWLIYLIGEKDDDKIKFCRYLLDTKLFIPKEITKKKITITFENKEYILDHGYFMRKRTADDNPIVVRMINRKRKILNRLGYFDLIKEIDDENKNKDETVSY